MVKKYNTKEIQDRLLCIVKDFDVFCKKHDLTYCLMGGSALGAMRHRGFIPWDDDIDVFMSYDNYHKFLKLFKEDHDEKYFLQSENTDSWPLFLSQIRENNTTFISDDWSNNKKMHHGLFIDIMCLYDAPKNTLARYVQYCMAMCLKVNALCKSGYPTENIVKKILLSVSNVLVNKYTRPLFLKYVSSYKENSEYLGHYFGRARFKYTSFPKTYLGTPRYVDFEDTKLPVMAKVEDYLRIRYGTNWNKMPDQKTKDQYPVHGGFVDLENDYSKYINKI